MRHVSETAFNTAYSAQKCDLPPPRPPHAPLIGAGAISGLDHAGKLMSIVLDNGD